MRMLKHIPGMRHVGMVEVIEESFEIEEFYDLEESEPGLL